MLLGDEAFRRRRALGRVGLGVSVEQLDRILLRADLDAAGLVHRLGPEIVAALGHVAAGGVVAGQLNDDSDLELLGLQCTSGYGRGERRENG